MCYGIYVLIITKQTRYSCCLFVGKVSIFPSTIHLNMIFNRYFYNIYIIEISIKLD